MKTKLRYELNIGIFLVVGVVFLIWGFILLGDALTIRKNLKNIYDENVAITELKEGNYVTVDNIKTLGYCPKDMNRYVTGMCVMLSFNKAYNYCAINYNGDEDKYISLLIETLPNKEVDLKTDDAGNVLLSDNDEIFKGSFDFKVVKMDSGHLDSINSIKKQIKSNENGINLQTKNDKEISFYNGVALKTIDYDKEREVLIWALSILFCAVILILASKPWKIIEKKYEPVREFNIIYNDKPNENDVAVAAEIARTLRLDILRYEDDYKVLKKNIRNNIIAVVVSGLVAYGVRYIGVFYILTFILFIKLIGSIIKLIFNNDTYFTRNLMKIFSREPIKSVIKDRQGKIAKCDKVISDSIYNRDELEF